MARSLGRLEWLGTMSLQKIDFSTWPHGFVRQRWHLAMHMANMRTQFISYFNLRLSAARLPIWGLALGEKKRSRVQPRCIPK